MRWVGEASGEHTIKARRVDVSVSKNEIIPLVPPKIIADFYLIDSSGSMNDDGRWNKWVYAIKYWKPSHARVFVHHRVCIERQRVSQHTTKRWHRDIVFILPDS